jgi:WD40 repeat protein
VDRRVSPVPVRALAFSPDGKLLASDKGLWDVATGTWRPGFAADNGGQVRALAFAPDGKTLAVGSEREAAVRFYSVATGKVRGRLEARPGGVAAAVYSPDGKTLATGGKDRTARLWGVATGRRLHELAHPEEVTDVAWAPDGRRLATTTPRAVYLWEIPGGKLVHRFAQDMNDLHSLSFSPDGRRLVSAGRAWDLGTGKEVFAYQGWLAGGSAFSPDGKVFATAGYDGVVRLHDPATGKELPHPAAGGAGAVVWLSFTPDGRHLLTLRNGAVHLWQADGRQVREVAVGARVAALSPDGAVLASVNDAGLLTLAEVATGEVLRQLPGGRESRNLSLSPAVAFTTDGRLVASAGYANDIQVWEVRTGRAVRSLRGHGAGVYHLTFTPDGRELVSAGLDQSVRFWDLATGKERRPPAHPPGWVRGLSPDGRLWVLSAEESGREGPVRSLRVCEAETGREVVRLAGVSTNLGTFSPDGRSLAVQGNWLSSPESEDVIHLVELATGGVRARFRGHRGVLQALTFSADGRTLASGSWDTTALLWDLIGPRDGTKDPPALWQHLASEDAAVAWRAMGALVRAPGQSVPWLCQHLPTVRATDGRRAERLLRDLNDAEFSVREGAERELEKLGEAAAPALRQALRGQPSPEARRRVQGLLERLDPGRSSEALRGLRAVEVLELVGTPAARRVLAELAGGIPEALRAQEARASLERLGRRVSNAPWVESP